MAKKKLATACGCSAPEAPDYKPRLWIDLDEKNIDILDDITVGKQITVALKGKVIMASKRENENMDEKKKVTGEFQLEGYEVEIITKNDFEALAEED